MLATANIMGENPWYADSGANNHITYDESEFTTTTAFEGFKQLMEKDLSSGRITLQEPHKDGLYPMHFLHQHNYKALSSQIPTAATWHRRLAHPSFQVLQKVCQNTCFIIYY